jgi:hypothetical protein
MGNNIEENIEILEKFKNNKIQRDKLERDVRCGGWKIGDIYKCLELNNAIDNILSDYKKVLKENEILKEEKEQAWEEWNNLEQGSYETELKLKEENRELKAEMKDGVIAIKLNALQTENEKLKNKLLDTLEGQKVIKEEKPQYIKENFIPVEKVKNKIEHYQKLQHNYIEKYDEINEGLQAMISALEELLGKE